MFPKMCVKFFLFLFITIFDNEIVHTKTSVPVTPYDVRNFDYDYQIASREFPYSTYRQNSSPATPRPFLSYWQNIMRNVRVPVPSITWNITNPLMNLINMGGEQPIQSTPTEENNDSNSLRRQKKRKRKNSHKKHHRKNKIPIENSNHEQPNELSIQQQQMWLQQYPYTAYPNEAMYFYDPNTAAYYTVQRVRPLDSYIDGAYYNVDPYVDTKHRKATISETSNLNEADTENISTEDADTENDVNFDEEEDINVEKMNLRPSSKNVVSKKNKSSKNKETLRSLLNSSMLDDHFNRQRKPSNANRRESSTLKLKPKNNRRYYFLTTKI